MTLRSAITMPPWAATAALVTALLFGLACRYCSPPMPRPTDTALKNRARTLLEAMTEQSVWVYAIPFDALDTARAAAEKAGLSLLPSEESDAGSLEFVPADDSFSIVLTPQPELEVTLLEADGEGAAALLGGILAETSFFAQSQLLSVAYDLTDEEAPQALGTLAHMAAVWDADWEKLFGLHLSAADPALREEAVNSVAMAGLRSYANEKAIALLERAATTEADAQIKAAITAAITALTDD